LINELTKERAVLMIVGQSKVTLSELGVEGISRLEVDPAGTVVPFGDAGSVLFANFSHWNVLEVSNLIEALEKAREIMGTTPAGSRPLPASKEEMLRGAAADWTDTFKGRIYGHTVLDILDA
jgi:hypothetical protein